MELSQISFFGYNDRVPNNMKSDTTVHVTRPVELLHRQHQQNLLNKTAEECGIIVRRRYSKGEDNSSRHSGCERSSNDDSTSGNYLWYIDKRLRNGLWRIS